MKRRISTILLILALASTVWAAPNIGGSSSGSGGSSLAAVDASIALIPSVISGEAPLAVDFTVTVHGTSLGKATWFYLLCNDDASNILSNTGSVVLQSQGTYSATYMIDGVCIYESAGAKTASLWYTYRGVANSVDADITVTESVGSIGVELEVEPLVSTETTDLTMTATVTGEDANNTECKFWCDCDSPDAQYDELGVCNAPDAGAGVSTSDPGVTGVCTDTTSCVNLTVGEYTAAVACQRNGQEDTAYVPYTILADTISIQGLTADPSHGDTGGGTLDNVELEVTFTTTCDSAGTFDIEFDCTNNAGFEFQSLAEDIADFVDDEGLVTYALRADGLSGECDGYPVGTTEAEVTIDCENAVQATEVVNVVGENTPATTFWFSAFAGPYGGVEPLDDVHVWIYGLGGTATGDIDTVSVGCGNGAPEPDFSALTIPSPTSSVYDLFALGVNCDYATDAVYTGYVTGTRDTVTFTNTFTVTVTPQPNPPIFQLSETSFNRMALAGEDADDVVFTVGNIGGSNLEWDEDPVGAGESETWLSCTPDAAVMNATAGPANGESEEITCTITSSTLGTGSYSATIIYTDPNATPTTPDTPVTVDLTVSPVSTPIHLEVDLNLATTGGSIASGPSPLAVSFSTVDISDGVNHADYTGDTRHEDSTVVPFTDLYYEWDFGDDDFLGLDCQGADSGNLGCRWDAVATNRLSRNYMTGPLGAHVYEPATFPDTCTGAVACKIYYPTLRVTDEDGNSASWSGTVNVYDPDATGANGWGDAGETVCIYPNAGAVGAGCPAVGTAYRSPADDFDADLTTRIAAGYQRILFQGGGTWDMDAEYKLEDAQAGMIGAYGTGDVIVDLTLGYNEDAFNISSDNWRIQDITFTSTSIFCDWSSGADAGIDVLFTSDIDLTQTSQVKNLLIQRTTANDSDFCGGLRLSTQFADSGPDSQAHQHIFIVDNEWVDHNSQTVYGAMNSLSVLGNIFEFFTGGTTATHTIRTEGGERILVSNNRIGAAAVAGDDGSCAIQYRDLPMENCPGCSGCSKDSNCKPLCGKPLKHYVTQDNDFRMRPPCGITVGGKMCGFSSDPVANMPQSNFIFEKNYFYPHPDGFSSIGNWGNIIETGGPELNNSSSNFGVRNNISDSTGFWGMTRFISQGGHNVDFYNNTCYRSDSRTDTAYCIQINSSGAGSECRNNVFYAPNYAGTVDWSYGSCTTESTNFDSDVEGSITTNPFYSPAPTARWGFWPKDTDTQIRNQGTDIPSVFDDALNTCRKDPLGGIDAGALEYPYAAGDGPVDGVPGCR